MNENFMALKYALENLNTLRSTRRILSGILSQNSEKYELMPKL